jgi:hypothetical protein
MAEITVLNLTPEITVLSEGNNKYTIDFGTISKGSSKTVKFSIHPARHNRYFIQCMSCTSVETVQHEHAIELNITYTGRTKGGITKKVVEYLMSGKQIEFNLIGTVK